MMTRSQMARTLLNAAQHDGGITLSAENYSSPDVGYVVGGVSRTLIIAGYTVKNFRSEALHSIEDWLVTRPGFFGETIPTGFIGSWQDDKGSVYIDQVDILESKESAIALAAKRGEIAIYSLHDGEEITI